MTIVGDRESDIYEEFSWVPDARTDVLVRAKANRILVGQDKKLFGYLSEQPIRKSFLLVLSGNSKRAKRTAQMQLRFTALTRCSSTGGKFSATMFVSALFKNANNCVYSHPESTHSAI